ncbi:MAG: hypothetical protein JEZ08_06755 [Clostridiales bacterium]|nr:hypothetical protein [Clostridiales bacterium]
MSKLVKSSQIIIDKKKYVLNNDFFVPKQVVVESDEEVDEEVPHDNVSKVSYEDELREMKEAMLEAVKVEKDQVLSNVREERDLMIQEAYDKSKDIQEQARKEGYDQGYQDGVANGYGEASSFIDEALEIKKKYFEKYEQIKTDSEADITGVIISTVESILNKHVEEDYDLINGLVEKAIKKCAFTTNLSLRVSPEDYEGAISIKKYILSLTENVDDIEIKQDNALPKGSCVVDSDAGSVDSSIHTQFENVKNKFIELLQSE